MGKTVKLQSVLLKPFEYEDDGKRVSTIITARLDKAIRAPSGSGSQVDDIILFLTPPDGASIKVLGRARGQYWEDTSSDEDSTRTLFRLFTFQLNNLTLGSEYQYDIKQKDRSGDYQSLVFKPLHGERRFHLRRSRANATVKAERIRLKTPQYALGEKTESFNFAAAADQEVMSIGPDRPGEGEISFSDHRDSTVEIYKELNRKNYQHYFHLGDIFFGEGLPPSPVEEYWEFQGHLEEDFASVVRGNLGSTAAARMLDDHDLGKNGASAEDFSDPDSSVHVALQVFQDNWPVPDNGDKFGLYYETMWGDIHCFCLHNRVYAEEGSLLGKEQRQWLEDRLMNTQGIKFVFTPLPFVMGKKPSEDYRGKGTEWQRLLQLFAATGVKAIFSADSHNYSRTDLTITVRNQSVTIPHFVVGTLGGKVQHLTTKEFDSMVDKGQPILADGNTAVSGKVQTYYGSVSWLNVHNRLYRYGQGKPQKVKRTYGYLDAKVNSVPGKRRRLQTGFMTVKPIEGDSSSDSDHDGFYNLDAGHYPCSENEDERYVLSQWPQTPTSWRDMEIEAKWDIDRTTYLAMIEHLKTTTAYGYTLNIRWRGLPRVFVDNYYDKPDHELRTAMHNLRHRRRYQHKQREWDWQAGESSLFNGFNQHPEQWTEQWQRIQYKTTPSRVDAVWFRHEIGDCRVYDEDGDDLCAGFEENSTELYKKALSGEISHEAMNAVKLDHGEYAFTEGHQVIQVVDFRYRVEFLQGETVIYEMSLDHLQSTNRETGEVKESFEAELEIVKAKDERTEEDVLGLFRLAEKVAWHFNLKPSTHTKGNVEVPDTLQPAAELSLQL